MIALSGEKQLVAITGGAGFIGRALCLELGRRQLPWRAVVRRPSNINGDSMVLGDIGPSTQWQHALEGVDCVIHCAARAHIIREQHTDPLNTYRFTNVAGTRNLAQQAAALGVRRLVFLSSVGVLGSHTNGRGPFRWDDSPAPGEPYALSKWQAECELHEISRSTNLEIVIVRPPIVYGPGAKGNFGRLIGLLERGFPLPFGSITNRRSMVGLDNLLDLIICTLSHPAAVGQTFLVCDGEDVSTPDLVRIIADVLGRPARLIRVPTWLLKAGARLTGHDADVERLISSLQVDMAHTQELLGWRPRVNLLEGLRRSITIVNDN